MDEAMHPLTLMVVGLYGEVLPSTDGAPLRLAVPWKYGFEEWRHFALYLDVLLSRSMQGGW